MAQSIRLNAGRDGHELFVKVVGSAAIADQASVELVWTAINASKATALRQRCTIWTGVDEESVLR